VNLSICLLKVIQNSLFSEKKDANRMFVVILKDIADFVFIVILCEITEEKKTQTLILIKFRTRPIISFHLCIIFINQNQSVLLCCC